MRRFVLAAALLAGVSGSALAAGTVVTTLSTTAYTDLGVAPVAVQALGGNVWVVVADSLPSAVTLGTQVIAQVPPVIFDPADASSHVYALALGSGASVAANPVYAYGGGGGAVTQGTTPWVDDVAQWANVALGAPSAYGTSPGAVNVLGVNAFVTNPLQLSGYSYSHITADATSLLKSGAGVLHTVCVNTAAATSTVTVDDALTATTPTIAVVSGALQGCQTFDVAFNTGLTIVTAVATPDITVSWR